MVISIHVRCSSAQSVVVPTVNHTTHCTDVVSADEMTRSWIFLAVCLYNIHILPGHGTCTHIKQMSRGLMGAIC